MSAHHEIPPAKTSNTQAKRKQQTSNKQKPKPTGNARNQLSNARQISQASGPNTVRNKGTYMILTVYSGDKGSVFIDRTGVMGIPQLFNDFKIYEKYFVHAVELEFVPNQPVTVGGSFTVAPDYDPIDPFPLTLSSMSASFNFVRKPITSKTVCKMPNFKLPDGNYMRTALYTGPADVDRNVAYGKFVYEADSSLSDGVSVGSLILHWDISFMVKQPLSLSTGYDYGSRAIKSVCDDSGTITPAGVVNSTEKNEFSLYETDHTTLDTLSPYSIYSGVITALTNCSLATAAGATVPSGSRVYFRPATRLNDGTTTSPSVTTTSTVGDLALSRTFDYLTQLFVNRSADAWIDLKNVSTFL